ncbi:MAG: sugar phosphate isomerase/epimerase [Clostridia bacterium]|nr:sugar phosphate isomerase/epimerase [Clostridia bacterium]
MRKLGINFETDFWPGMDEQAGLALLREAGFDCFFTDYYADDAVLARYAKAAAQSGMVFESMHAPFSSPISINAIWHEGADGDAMLEALLDTIRACQRYGVRVAVVHLSSGDNAPCVNDTGHRRLDRLVDEAVRRNVVIGFENQRKLANLAFVFELYDNVPQVRFCWDVGHEACFTPGREYMPLFGSKLTYTHIHDNLCQYNGDLHMIPFDGKIDFSRVAERLREYDYQGSLTLELLPRKSGYYSELTAREYYSRAFGTAVRLRGMLDQPCK